MNCCHQNNTVELATCGLGASCAGTCSAHGATLCPSGDCAGDCEIPFDQEPGQTASQRRTLATQPAVAFKWCSPQCNVWKHKGCCYNPACNRRRSRACRWMNFLTGPSYICIVQALSQYLFRKYLSIPGQFAQWIVDLWGPGGAHSWHLFFGWRCPVVPRLAHMNIIRIKNIFYLALQCRLECEPGFVSQQTPLITCVDGKYVKSVIIRK